MENFNIFFRKEIKITSHYLKPFPYLYLLFRHYYRKMTNCRLQCERMMRRYAGRHAAYMCLESGGLVLLSLAALIIACVSHCAARVNFTKYHTKGAKHGHSLRETRPANESENSGGSFPHVSSHVLDN